MSSTDANLNVFDDFVEDYEEACARGVQLSGESRDYFACERIRLTAGWCSKLTSVHRVVDFGCGLGASTPHLAAAFPDATVVGIDTSAAAIDAARRRYGSDRTRFVLDARAVENCSAELVYSNGTFHHIEPLDRPAQVRTIRNCLAPGGLFALWENNPWNPGTRLVMRRIPFDRDAKPLSYLEGRRLLRAAGLEIVSISFHFYFPAVLKALRPLEPALTHLPLGAQYCLFARRPREA